MFKAIGKSATVCMLIGCMLAAPHAADARTSSDAATRDVDLVIALDVSGSMSGLIASAKQRLWDITNELARAQPTPALRVAILSYGNPRYGARSGYVRLDLAFTADLDAVNATLFAFQTEGGEEYVSRVVQTSLKSLQWSRQPDALRIIFVAGNESAEQDPEFGIVQVMRAAAQQDVVVNAIYCGSANDAVAHEWQRVAALANGIYASIDQNVGAVAQIATPVDAALVALNDELNATYLPFGRDGNRSRENLLAQDQNAAAMSAPAAASRTVTKVPSTAPTGISSTPCSRGEISTRSNRPSCPHKCRQWSRRSATPMSGSGRNAGGNCSSRSPSWPKSGTATSNTSNRSGKSCGQAGRKDWTPSCSRVSAPSRKRRASSSLTRAQGAVARDGSVSERGARARWTERPSATSNAALNETASSR